jgi:hypothetical protein
MSLTADRRGWRPVLKLGSVPPPDLVPPLKISRWYRLQCGVVRLGKLLGSDILNLHSQTSIQIPFRFQFNSVVNPRFIESGTFDASLLRRKCVIRGDVHHLLPHHQDCPASHPNISPNNLYCYRFNINRIDVISTLVKPSNKIPWHGIFPPHSSTMIRCHWQSKWPFALGEYTRTLNHWRALHE